MAHYRRSKQTDARAAVTHGGAVNNSRKPFAHDIEPVQFTMTILFIVRNLISEYFEILVDRFTTHCTFFFFPTGEIKSDNYAFNTE